MNRLAPILVLISLGALAATPNQAVLSWTAPTTYSDGTPVTDPITYTVYQGLQGQPKAKGPTGITATTVTISTGLLSGRTYCWAVTAATATSPESAPSAEACKTFPPAAPEAPANLTVH